MSEPSQVTRVTSPPIEAALSDALELFGEVEATLDRQIYPQQAKEGFDAPAREYTVTLTAAAWRKFNAGMQILERAAQNISDQPPGEET